MPRQKGLASILFKAANPSVRRPKSLRSHARSLAKSAWNVNKGLQTLHIELSAEAERQARIRTRHPENAVAYETKVRAKLGDTVDRLFYKKLVGVSFKNRDGSNRKQAIRLLEEHQELTLFRETDNPVDTNAILVTTLCGNGLGYLDARLAGEVSRSLAKGVGWHCFVRRVLTTEGTNHCGVTVCLVKHKKKIIQKSAERTRHSKDYVIKNPITAFDLEAPVAKKTAFEVFQAIVQRIFD